MRKRDPRGREKSKRREEQHKRPKNRGIRNNTSLTPTPDHLESCQQNGKLQQRPIVLVGEDYWCGLYQWLVEQMQVKGFIGAEDLDYLQIVADAEAAADILLTYFDGTTCGTS